MPHFHKKFFLLFLSIAIVMGLRCAPGLVSPALELEDGQEIVGPFVSDPRPSSILRNYQGYVPLLPNLVGFLAVRMMPFEDVPYCFAWVSFLLSVIGCSLFGLRRYRYLVPDDRTRFGICLGLALLPLGDEVMVTNLTYSIWNLLWIVVLLCAGRFPGRSISGLLHWVGLVLGICSTPMSVICVPLCLAGWWLADSTGERSSRAVTLGVICLYFVFGLSHEPRTYLVSWGMLATALRFLAHRAVFEAFAGNQARLFLTELAGKWVVDVASGLLILAGLWCYWKGQRKTRADLGLLTGVSYLLGSMTVLPFVMRPWLASRCYELDGYLWLGRYCHVPRLVLLVTAGMILSRLSWPSSLRRSKLLAVILSSYVLALGWSNRPFFWPSTEEGGRVRGFLRAVQQASREPGLAHLVYRRTPYYRSPYFDHCAIYGISVSIPNR
jgi:hypothetical protein